MNCDEGPKPSRGPSKDFTILVVVVLLAAFLGPPILNRIGHSTERKRIYADSLQRVEKAGGWQAIESASLAFAKDIAPKAYFTQDYYNFQGKREGTNELPATLEVLKPRSIELEPDERGIPLLRIKLYGIHRTGAVYDQPYFGIWVITTNVPSDYVPQFPRDRDWAGRRGLIEREGKLIFEAR